MKKAKISLALAAGLVATIGLSSCNEVTSKGEIVLTYTDGQGRVVDYSAEDLFKDYQLSSSSKSTNFDKVYELMIRKYYDSVKSSELTQINNKAQNSVNDDMKTAATNAENGSGNYGEELEKILSNHGVETIDQDFEYWQYQHEKELFETTFYKEHLEELRDYGFTGMDAKNSLNNGSWISSSDEGYLKEKMPYHVRHILRKVSAASGELCQGKITSVEATKLAKVVTELAAGKNSFGAIATELSEDGSASSFGDLGKMDLDESYVNEFKLGVYAYDSLYRNAATKDQYGIDNENRIAPTEDREILDSTGNTVTVKEFFEQKGIGTIPYGAAIALANAAEIDSSNLGYKINEDNESFLPRNILFNKYFNKHNVCVITPNDIPYNSGDPEKANTIITDENGTPSSDFANLPGFTNDTTNLIGFPALTDTDGHLVLVVRAGASGNYEGVHFIVVERSALDETVDEVSLKDYWTTDAEAAEASEKTNYINFFKEKPATYKDRAEKVKGWIKGYNTNINSYIFGWLINENQIQFTDEKFGEEIQSYVNTKIEQSKTNTEKTRCDTWKTYAEYLVHQDYLRSLNAEEGTGYLISETCAIGYLSKDARNGTGLWAKGGACYGK